MFLSRMNVDLQILLASAKLFISTSKDLPWAAFTWARARLALKLEPSHQVLGNSLGGVEFAVPPEKSATSWAHVPAAGPTSAGGEVSPPQSWCLPRLQRMIGLLYPGRRTCTAHLMQSVHRLRVTHMKSSQQVAGP